MEGIQLYEEIHRIAQKELFSKHFEIEKLPNNDGSYSYEVTIYSDPSKVGKYFLLGYSFYTDPDMIFLFLPDTTIEYPLNIYKGKAREDILNTIKTVIKALGQKKLLRVDYYLGKINMAQEYWIEGSSKALFNPSFRWYKYFRTKSETLA